MRKGAIIWGVVALWGTVVMLAGNSSATLRPGQSAPTFALQDLQGHQHALTAAKKHSMTVLFFFDPTSRPSQESLMMLDKLGRQYQKAGLAVWGITRSNRQAVQDFVRQADPKFPILLDSADISSQYDARLILPVICTLDNELKVIDYYQGGGKTVEIMMVRLAQRQLHRQQTMLAKAISDKVIAKNPQSVEARTVKGYAALKGGDLDGAAQVFDQLAQEQGEAEVAGKEGQAAVLAQKGQTAQALKLVAEVEQKAPQRAYIHMIKGDVLTHEGKHQEAGQAYQQAAAKQEGEPFQKAEALNRLGQYQARLGKYTQARQLYDQAVALDPFFVEPTSNKGVTYQKEGHWDQALAEYRKALKRDAEDSIVAALARKAEEMLALQKDQQRRQHVDKLVKELAERFRQQQTPPAKSEDTWTSRPLVVSLVDFEEKGGMAVRDGFALALTTQLGERLNASGRVKVVERVLLERLIEELNLGTSDLADKETALHLGRVLAAQVLGTGAILYLPNTTMLSMRLIDTETTAVPKSFTLNIGQQASLDRQLFELNRDLLRTLIQTYPLRGYVVQAQGDTVMLNLGTAQGLVNGTQFAVIEEAAPITYKGRTLRGTPKTVAELEVVRVEPDLSHARILSRQRDLRTDDKVEEVLRDAGTP